MQIQVATQRPIPPLTLLHIQL